MKHHKKRIIPLILVMLMAAGIGYWHTNRSETNDMVLTGEIETTMVSNMSEVSAIILEMPVELGQPVKKGDVIAVLDDSDQQYALRQGELALEQKKTALAELNKGTDAQQINQAQNSVSIAQANYNSAEKTAGKAADDYKTLLAMYENGAAAKSALDSARLLMESTASAAEAAQAQIDSARQQVSLLAQGAKDTAVKSLALDIEIAENQLSHMRGTLQKYTIRAQADGIIMSKNYTAGAAVAQGADLAVIASDAEKYLVVYVPSDHLHRIQYDQQIQFEGADMKGMGIVKYIDTKSRYTPKDLQTPANKNRESIKVKLLLENDPCLIPAERLTVIIPQELSAGGKP